MGGDVIDHIGGGYDLAEHAARSCHEQDRTNGHQRVIAYLVELLHLSSPGKLDDSENGADSQRDDGRAEEFHEIGSNAGHICHRGDRGQRHQYDGDDYRRDSAPSAGELAIFSDELLIGLRDLAHIRLIVCFHAFSDVFRIEKSGNQRENRAKSAHAHDYDKAVADAEGVGGSDGTGRRGDKHMGYVQSCGQADRHGYRRDAGSADQGFTYRVQDDEAGIAEHRDGDDPAHKLHGQDRIVLAYKMDDHIGKLQGCAGLFEYAPDQSSQNDHYADA